MTNPSYDDLKRENERLLDEVEVLRHYNLPRIHCPKCGGFSFYEDHDEMSSHKADSNGDPVCQTCPVPYCSSCKVLMEETEVSKLNQKNAELLALVGEMREALEEAEPEISYYGNDEPKEKVKHALSLTPPLALRERDARIWRAAAEVAKSMFADDEWEIGYKNASSQIRYALTAKADEIENTV